MSKILPPRVIFRVEHHESKFGPYRHDPGTYKGERALEATLSLVGKGRDGDLAHPAPSAEFGDEWIEIGERSYQTYCGFANLRQLRAWFGEQVLTLLTAQGFIIAVYYVKATEMLIGETQVVFDMASARRIGERQG